MARYYPSNVLICNLHIFLQTTKLLYLVVSCNIVFNRGKSTSTKKRTDYYIYILHICNLIYYKYFILLGYKIASILLELHVFRNTKAFFLNFFYIATKIIRQHILLIKIFCIISSLLVRWIKYKMRVLYDILDKE